ncbi:MAG: GNAT family N-acetyltransferase [Solirubrobacteraceae bacterium]
MERAALLRTLDAYLDAAPRVASRVETLGPFTLFIGTGPWAYYARPTPGRGHEVTADAVSAVRARQRALGKPPAIEWVADLAPGLAGAAAAAGLRCSLMPLMVLGAEPVEVPVPGVRTRVLESDDRALGAALAAAEVGFGAPGTSVGPEGVRERDTCIARLADGLAFRQTLIGDGHLVVVAAESDEGPVASGAAVPRGAAAELVGIATLPAWRRRGVAAMVVAALVRAMAARRVDTVLLTAGDEEVARVYERAGFRRVATSGDAEDDA